MPDANMPFEQRKIVFRERLGNQPHFCMHLYAVAVGDGDTCAFLTAMLESKEGKKGGLGHVYARRIDSKNTTTFMHKSCLTGQL